MATLTRRSLTGVPIRDTIAKDWKKASEPIAQKFDNQGFDTDLQSFESSVVELRSLLQNNDYDGVIVGWCMRGYKERTVMFETLVRVCFEELRQKPETKVIFCEGPEDLFGSTTRHFG